MAVHIKNGVLAALAAVGTFIANALGGWDAAMKVLVALMVADYITGWLVAGLILNVWLGLGIWDYTNMPGNVMGIICPQFTAAWVGLSLLAILLDDWLRYRMFGEDKPHYRLL